MTAKNRPSSNGAKRRARAKVPAGDPLPRRLTITGWLEEYDLRYLRRNALALAFEWKLGVGDALLVSGSRHHGARRFQILVQTKAGAMVMAPQTGEHDLLLGLMLRVHEFAAETFE